MAALALCALAAALQTSPVVLSGHHGAVSSVSFSPDGRLLASAGFDSTIRIWETGSGRAPQVLRGHRDEVLGAAFSPDGRLLVSTGFDRQVIIWDAATGRQIRAVPLPAYSTTVAVSSRGVIAVGSPTGTIRLLDAATGDSIRTLAADFAVNTLAWSPDGTRLATGGPVSLWDPATGAAPVIPRLPGGVHDLAWSPDGQVIATAHQRGITSLWRPATGTIDSLVVEVPVARRGADGRTSRAPGRLAVVAVAFSADGRRLAAGGLDRKVYVWDLQTRTVTDSLAGHDMSVVSLTWSPAGGVVASGSLDGTVRLWQVR